MIQKLEPRHFGPDSGFGGATFSDVIDKVNEIIDAMNGEHDPADIYSEDGRLIAKKDESEDERMIRKIEMFLSAYGADYFSNDEWREIEDWLEKQKEPTKEELYAEAGTTEKEYIANTMKMVRAMREKKQEQKPISSCDIVPYIDEKIAALQDMWREEKVSFDWDDMKDMIEDVARHFYHKEQKPSTGIYWHAIKKGDKIPCRAYLYKVAYETENNFGGRATIDGLLVPNIENVTCGCDTWYLPADDVKNLPREGLDELQKEQKPVDDSDFKTKLAEYMTKNRTGYSYSISSESILEMAKEELIKRGVVQKPAEWSEEDKKILDDVSHILIGLNYKQIAGDYKQAVEKLIYARPSWKPSELEKGALRTAIHILTDERSFPKAAKQLQNILDAFDGKESRKDWKPTEEQMEALRNAFHKLANTDVADSVRLSIMYDNLKKL